MKLYSTKEFAELAGVSIRTLKRWRKSGKLVPKTIKGDKFYYEEQLAGVTKYLRVTNSKVVTPEGDKIENQNLLKIPYSNAVKTNLTNSQNGDKKSSSGDTTGEMIIMTDKHKFKPTKNLFLPIDKLSREIFDVTIKKNKDTFTNELVEDKKLQIVTVYYFEPLKGDLTQFDKAIFCAACSEFSAGNEIFTLQRLFHRIGGGHHLTTKMKKLIFESVERLANTRFITDLTQIESRLNKPDKEKNFTFRNYLLPCKAIETHINGKLTDAAFQFLDEPPLMKIAQLKRQFITCDAKLLEIPTARTTEQTTAISSYLLERILSIIGSHQPHKKHFIGKGKDGKSLFKQAKQLPKTILIETVFKQCRITNATDKQKHDARQTIEKVMEHFKTCGVISEWHSEKENAKICRLIFDWN